MTSATRESRDRQGAIDRSLGLVAETQTYKNLLYLALAFPLAMVYWMVLMFGFAFGAILSVLLVGIAILIGTVLGSRLLAGAERWLANALLDVDLGRPTDVNAASEAGPWATVRDYLDAASTWRGLGFLMTKFWVGVVAFVLLFLFAGALSLVTSPLRYPHEVELVTVNDEPIVWVIDSLPEALLAVPLGLALGVFFLHVLNGLAHVCGRMAIALLGDVDSVEGESATGRGDGRKA